MSSIGRSEGPFPGATPHRWNRVSLAKFPSHSDFRKTLVDAVDAYFERSGRERPADWVFYEVYGLFRLAVIIQQIYYRYHHRQTRNPAFKHFWFFVWYLDRRCRRLLGGGGEA